MGPWPPGQSSSVALGPQSLNKSLLILPWSKDVPPVEWKTSSPHYSLKGVLWYMRVGLGQRISTFSSFVIVLSL